MVMLVADTGFHNFPNIQSTDFSVRLMDGYPERWFQISEMSEIQS